MQRRHGVVEATPIARPPWCMRNRLHLPSRETVHVYDGEAHTAPSCKAPKCTTKLHPLQSHPGQAPIAKLQSHQGVRRRNSRCQAASHQGVRRGRHHCKAARCTKNRPPLPDATPWRCTKIRLPMPSCKAARCTKSKKPLPSCKAAKVYQGEAPTAQLQSRPAVYEEGSIIATL